MNNAVFAVCSVDDLIQDAGVAVRAGDDQVAVFLTEEGIFALDNLDPFSGAAVLARGIVGDVKGKLVVASPMYKQHFCLKTGVCLEDPERSIRSWPAQRVGDRICLHRPTVVTTEHTTEADHDEHA